MNNSNSPKSDELPKVYDYRPIEVPKKDKASMLWLMLTLVFLIIFNVFFFLLGGTAHNVSVWMSYGFIHLAYFMLVITPHITRKGKSTAVFGFALYSISSAYFFVALIVGVIFIVISPESYTAPLLVQLSVAGLYAIMLISHLIADEFTANAEEKRHYQIDYVKTAASHLKRILGGVEDKSVKRTVEKVYDIVNSSPVKTHPNVAQIEMRIMTLIDELADAVLASEKQTIMSTADLLLSAVNERNNQLKRLNM